MLYQVGKTEIRIKFDKLVSLLLLIYKSNFLIFRIEKRDADPILPFNLQINKGLGSFGISKGYGYGGFGGGYGGFGYPGYGGYGYPGYGGYGGYHTYGGYGGYGGYGRPPFGLFKRSVENQDQMIDHDKNEEIIAYPQENQEK